MVLEGWNGYNHYHNRLNEKLVQKIADTIVATGLAAVGYEYGLFLILSHCIKLLFFCNVVNS